MKIESMEPMRIKEHSEETCFLCMNNKEFDLPDEVMTALHQGSLVIFAGAGISTEKRGSFPFSFYADVAKELGIGKDGMLESFSKLMSRYSKGKNGRKKLLNKIRARLEYAKSFPSLYQSVTSFHQELAHIHQIRDIFTTNWDDFFEVECGAIPIVASRDFAFWDIPERKVFKLHGSINNIGSLVVTHEDYIKCYKELSKSLIGSYLRLALGTKTVVFIGYSLEDEDFRKVYSLLKRDLADVLPHSYLVTLDKQNADKIKSKNITPIITDGTYFLHKLKKELIKKQVLIDDGVYDVVERLLESVLKMHTVMPDIKEFTIQRNPILLYTYFYQDGLIDALQRAIAKKTTGTYLCPTHIHGQLKLYEEQFRKDAVKAKRYHDVAYIDGYMNGLFLFVMWFIKKNKMIKNIKNSDLLPPLLYVYGYGEVDGVKEFRKIIKRVFHRGAYKQAQSIVKRKCPVEGTVMHHSPFL